MKIAIMSAWNTDSGVSIHAELIGRQWIKMGHQLQVFTFYPYDFHGTTIIDKDEDYVIRCFTTSGAKNPYLDPKPILSSDYEIFVVQDLGMLPMDELAKIFHHIKRKAVTLTIIHDNKASENPSFYQFDWDRIICFDERYEAFLRIYHPIDKIQIIPFPCHPLKRGDKEKAKQKLGLPLNKKIIFIFGQRIKEYLKLFPIIRDVNLEVPILLLIVSEKDVDGLQGTEGLEIEIRKESPSHDKLYDYLHASDVLIIYRNPCDGVVISSSAFQCLGSGCPILANESRFFEKLKEVVLIFRNLWEFKKLLIDILNKGEKYKSSQNALEDFMKRNSAEIVAKDYIELFIRLKEERKQKEFEQIFRTINGMKTSDFDGSFRRNLLAINE